MNNLQPGQPLPNALLSRELTEFILLDTSLSKQMFFFSQPPKKSPIFNRTVRTSVIISSVA